MIKFRCKCGQKIGVPDDAAGKRCKCPKCSAISIVPTPESDVSPLFELTELQEMEASTPTVEESIPVSYHREPDRESFPKWLIAVIILGSVKQ